MIRHLTCSADAYISARVIDGSWVYDGNVGAAGTLDLYKLYDQTFSIVSGSRVPNTELTRLLVKFDDAWLSSSVASNLLNINHSSFKATLVLKDAYGGQAVPDNLTIRLWPLSKSFDEGEGRDIVLLSDNDVTNWLTASSGIPWSVTGCGQMGLAPAACDYFTGSAAGPFDFVSTLPNGTEDLVVDITRAVKERCLSGSMPQLAFRISLESQAETDSVTYFVKRFSTRHAHDANRRPFVKLEWNESVWDDALTAMTDKHVTFMTAFYVAGRAQNIVSGSTTLTSSNCMILTLYSGSWSSSYSASQHVGASGPVTGLYSASLTLSSDDATVSSWLSASGSFNAGLKWTSLAGKILRNNQTVTFKDVASGVPLSLERTFVSFNGLRAKYSQDSVISVRLTTFDPGSPSIRVTKSPRISKNIPIANLHIGVIDAMTDAVVISPNSVTNSTLTSLTQDGHEWSICANALVSGNAYKLMAYVYENNAFAVIGDASPAFTIT